jgi:hypothetical protein
MKVKKLLNTPENRAILKPFPNFSSTGSIRGMKKMYYGKNALLVRCNGFIYNVSSESKIYEDAE